MMQVLYQPLITLLLHDITPEMQQILHAILFRIGEQQNFKDDAFNQKRAMLDAEELAAEASRIDAAVRALRTKSASSTTTSVPRSTVVSAATDNEPDASSL